MDLNWKHQIQCMTCNLRRKLENLNFSPHQAKDTIRIAISPSLALAVTPCTLTGLVIRDKMIDRTNYHKYNLSNSTAAAMIREYVANFRLRCPQSALNAIGAWPPREHPAGRPLCQTSR
eukprot:144816-Pelagomonas_calceolata.AAC.1